MSFVNPRRLKKLADAVCDRDARTWAEVLEQSEGAICLAVGNSLEELAELERSIDILVGDPPYWFNTGDTDMVDKQQFYGDFVRAAVASLRPGGQLMVTLPSFARNGRQIPFFQTREALVRQVLAEVERQKRQAVSVIHTAAERKEFFSPPFFWQSTSTLSRSVLWFTID
jgi:23S rRNA G2069 N7-methylase RlmK/C1962 C5-methylase RlmI